MKRKKYEGYIWHVPMKEGDWLLPEGNSKWCRCSVGDPMVHHSLRVVLGGGKHPFVMINGVVWGKKYCRKPWVFALRVSGRFSYQPILGWRSQAGIRYDSSQVVGFMLCPWFEGYPVHVDWISKCHEPFYLPLLKKCASSEAGSVWKPGYGGKH